MLALILVLLTVIQQSLAYLPSFDVEYCNHDYSTSRSIPALSAEERAQVKSLEQVQVIVRHGARTPWKAHHCWKDYEVTWTDCNVTELMIASPSYTAQDRPTSWLFRKIYDGSANYLNGNCYTGQLLLEGYQQEEAVGASLSQAYLSGDLKLFPTKVWTDINSTEFIYLRSDDEQRTLMSGQILLHTTFDISEQIIVPWHTGDYGLDQLYPNPKVCPRLSDIEYNAYSSNAWQAENSSAAVRKLNSDLDAVLGAGEWSWNYLFDCFMTSVCTNRHLPDGIDDALFNATIRQTEAEESFLNLYNQSEWAKLSMGNTWWHLRQNMESAIRNVSGLGVPAYKFALFSGHDTTIMPMLAALVGEEWDRVWPGYASMVAVELYQSATSSPETPAFKFRIVYNGKALRVPPCEGTLCDVDVLLDALSFAQKDMPCESTQPSIDDLEEEEGCEDPVLSSTEWIVIVVMCTLAGVLVGAGVVVFYDRRKLKYDGKGEYTQKLIDEEDSSLKF